MPDKAEQAGGSEGIMEGGASGKVAEKAGAANRKRLRPRWQSWLLWASVRLLLVAGVGAGVGTLQMRARPPNLMAHARRIASLARASGYYWLPNGELRLFAHQNNGTASLRWNPETQSATFVEMLPMPKGKSYIDPMGDHPPYAQTFQWPDKQVQIVGAYKIQQNYQSGKPMPKPDYTWKLRMLPNMPSSFTSLALSPNGRKVAYTCHVPRTNWRDEILRRFRWGYKAPFRGQGAAILISAVDGSRTEILGVVQEDMPAPNTPYNHSGTTFSLQGLSWRPDGKHLTFAYGDGVYEVPVK